MSSAAMDLRGATILAVDDVPANLDIFCESLEETGYEVQVAADGPSALEAVAYSAPELILLDAELPGANGYEICRQLKR